jgi:hypothetical protein
MTRGTECKCSSMQVNGLIQVRQDTLLLKPAIETQGKFAEVQGLIGMTRGMECKCISIQVNGFIQVRQDTPLLKPGIEIDGKVVERI